MRQDLAEFNAGLDALLSESRHRVDAVDRVGFALNDETMRLNALSKAIERRHAAARNLIEVMSLPAPTPASEARRLQTEAQIAQALPRSLAPAA